MTDTEINERLATEVMGYVRGETRAMIDCWLEYALPDSIREIRDWNPLKIIDQAILCRDALMKANLKLAFYLFRENGTNPAPLGRIRVEFYVSDGWGEYISWADTDARAICEAIIAVIDAEKGLGK